MAWSVWAARPLAPGCPPAPGFLCAWPEIGPSLARVRAARARCAAAKHDPPPPVLHRFAPAWAGIGGGKARSARFRPALGSEVGWVWLAMAGGIGPKAAPRRASGSAQIAPARILFARGACSFLRRYALAPCRALRRRLMRSAPDSPRRRAADGLTRRVGADSRWLENGGAQRFRRSMAAASRCRLSALSSPSRAWIASWVACLAFSQAPSAPSRVA